MKYYFNLVSGLLLMALSIQTALAVSRLFGSYWYGIAVLSVTSLIVTFAYRKGRIRKGYEYVVMILSFAFFIVGGGLVYSALHGVKPV